MEEKMKQKENEKRTISEKLTWEAPKLYSLDKGKTEGGYDNAQAEDDYAGTFTFGS